MTKYPKNRSLRMADGGSVITRWAQNIMRPTQTQTQARLRSMDAPAPAPVVAAPPVQTAAPVTQDNPAGIRFKYGGSLHMMNGRSSFSDGMTPTFSLGRMVDNDQNRQATADVFARTPDAMPSATTDTGLSTPGVAKTTNLGNRDRMMAAANFSQSMAYKPLMAMPQMKDGGTLRTGMGGHVPGSGSGDKIPAKYEPGEFVVSNDMLDSAPGLREQLHGLRGQVLAEKGMTVAEADAKAMGYDDDSTRSQDGQTYTQLGSSVPGRTTFSKGASLRTNAEMDAGMGRGGDRGSSDWQRNRGANPKAGITLRAESGFAIPPDAVEKARAAIAEAAHGARMNAEYNANFGLPPNPTVPVTPPGVTGASKTGRVRGALNTAGNFLTGAGESAGSVGGAFKEVVKPLGSAASSALKVAGKLAPTVAAGSAIYGGATTGTDQYADRFGIDNSNPSFGKDLALRAAGVASDAINYEKTDTETYAKRFGLEKTGPGFLRDLGVRALGIGSDVLSFGQAKRLDDPVAGANPVADANPVAASPTKTTFAPSAAGGGRGSINPPNVTPSDPDRVTLRGQTGTDMGDGISKFKTADGRTLYSNVTGPDNDKLMSNKPGLSIIPGMSREVIDKALGGMSASQVSGDNAIRAANLRDGVDMERGTSGEVAGRGAQNTLRLANSPLGTPGRSFAQKQLLDESAQATLRRGQDITREGNVMQNETSLRNNKATRDAAVKTAQRDQDNKDRDHKLNVEKFGVEKANTMFAQREKGEKDLTDSILQANTSTVDGKSVIDQKAANQTRQAFDTMIAKQIQDLQRSGTPEDLARAKNLADNKVNAIDPATRQKIIAAVKLMNKVGADGSNLNYFAPDHMGTSDPRDFMDLKKNKDGVYVTKQGKEIPMRYFAKQGADRFGGVPTNEFDILKGQ